MATLVEGDLKAPFLIATTPRCWGRCYSIPWIAPLYPWSLLYGAKQGSIKYHFWVFGMTQPGIEPWSPGALVNTLLIRPMASRLQHRFQEKLWQPSSMKTAMWLYSWLTVFDCFFSFVKPPMASALSTNIGSHFPFKGISKTSDANCLVIATRQAMK